MYRQSVMKILQNQCKYSANHVANMLLTGKNGNSFNKLYLYHHAIYVFMKNIVNKHRRLHVMSHGWYQYNINHHTTLKTGVGSLFVCYFLVCGFVTIVKAIFGTIIMVINFQRISIIAVIWG